jgi:hypothetical protein
MKRLMPRQVLDESTKNRAHVLEASERSFSGHFPKIRKTIAKVGRDRKKASMVLAHLAVVNHRLPKLGSPVEGTLNAIETLLADSGVIELSDAVMIHAANRALNCKAPCHRKGKNSFADAVMLETYIDALRVSDAGKRFAFFTDNHIDFSVTDGNFKLPHPDFASSFGRIGSMYFISLAECLRKIDPSLVSEVEWMATQEQPRGISEVLVAHELLFDQVWHNRHKYHEWEIKRGKVKVVSGRNGTRYSRST